MSPLPLSDFVTLSLSSLIMNIVVWNCRGALSPSFQSFFHDMAQIHSPAIMIITETKISG